MDPEKSDIRGMSKYRDDTGKTNRITMVLDAAANPTRLRILQTLRDEPRTFTEIALAMGLDIAADSGLLGFHLRSLTDQGLVSKSRHTYSITKLGKSLLSAVNDLMEIEEEEETMGMIIDEVDTSHMNAIKEFFKEEYGVDEDWLQSVEKTYSLLVSGRNLESEDGEILSLVALLDEKVVGFVGGRLVSDVKRSMSLSPEWEKDKEFYSWIKGKFPDLDTLKKMSEEDKEELVKEIMSRIGVSEKEVEKHDWLKTFFTPGHPEPRDAWLDMIWSTQKHEHLVKKKLLNEFVQRAGEKGAWSIQAYLRNPQDVALVVETGFAKADGQLCATYIGPREVLRRYGLMYSIRLGSSPLHWGFTHDKPHGPGVKLTDTPDASEGGISLSLDTTQLYQPNQ